MDRIDILYSTIRGLSQLFSVHLLMLDYLDLKQLQANEKPYSALAELEIVLYIELLLNLPLYFTFFLQDTIALDDKEVTPKGGRRPMSGERRDVTFHLQ